jgi:hypothetical protein
MKVMNRPSTGLLRHDMEYRKRERRDLHKIAPRRFNPDNVAWLLRCILNAKEVIYCSVLQYCAHELERLAIG